MRNMLALQTFFVRALLTFLHRIHCQFTDLYHILMLPIGPRALLSFYSQLMFPRNCIAATFPHYPGSITACPLCPSPE